MKSHAELIFIAQTTRKRGENNVVPETGTFLFFVFNLTIYGKTEQMKKRWGTKGSILLAADWLQPYVHPSTAWNCSWSTHKRGTRHPQLSEKPLCAPGSTNSNLLVPHHWPRDRSEAQKFLWNALKCTNLHIRNTPCLQVFSAEDQSLLPRTPNCISFHILKGQGKRQEESPAPSSARGAGRLLLPKEHALPKAIPVTTALPSDPG